VVHGVGGKALVYESLTVNHELALWAYSSVGLERPPDKREVGGSIPLRPTIKRREKVGEKVHS
jgi:hypothetical protein